MPEDTRDAAAPEEAPPKLTTGQLVEDPQLGIALRRLAGEGGLDRPLRHPRVQKNGLALVGHYHGVVPTRVQLLGETELSYLDSLSHDARSVAARGLFSLGLSCVVVTSGNDPPRTLVAAAEATSTPLFVSDARTSRTINALHSVLDNRLAPQTQLHGVLVDVHGVGILLL
ncbi:MAG TPA: HPr(Ser) kinase/phosphatase, partial [Polyangiaceae bacterium]|nr:HPr(Ser) kinase/phosphatase [Polyangiaceae bacterium]